MNRTTLTKKHLRILPCGDSQDGPTSPNSRRASARRCLRGLTAGRTADTAHYQQESVLAIETALCLISFRPPTKPWIDHTSVEPTLLAEPLANRSEKGRCIPLPCAGFASTNIPLCRSVSGGRRRSSKVFKLDLLRCARGAVLRRGILEPAESVARRMPFSTTTKSRCGPRSLSLGLRQPLAGTLKFARNPVLGDLESTGSAMRAHVELAPSQRSKPTKEKQNENADIRPTM